MQVFMLGAGIAGLAGALYGHYVTYLVPDQFMAIVTFQVWAALILGTIWMTWHAPSFLLSGTVQSGWDFAPFFLGGIAISLIMTAIFNGSHGSLLLPFLLHFQLNNPIWPDAQPWDSYLLAALAVVIMVLNRRIMFNRDAGVTQILMPENS
jgi:ABC-type branched-subunit amino acid transport system permease subunit